MLPQLSDEETRRIEQWSVECQRAKYSDEALWAWLLEFRDKELRILKQIHRIYRLAFSGSKHHKFWRECWNDLCVELRGIEEMMKLIAWHLEKRGDTSIANWLVEAEEFKRQSNKQWLAEAYWELNDD